MKKTITYYAKKHRFNFLFKGWKFYYNDAIGIYTLKSSPTIYLKKYSPTILKLEVKNCHTNKGISSYNPNYFQLLPNEYLIITYIDGTKKEFIPIYNIFGIVKFVERNC